MIAGFVFVVLNLFINGKNRKKYLYLIKIKRRFKEKKIINNSAMDLMNSTLQLLQRTFNESYI